MSHCPQYSISSCTTRGNEILPLQHCQPAVRHGDTANSYRASAARPSISRETKTFHKQLGKSNPGPVGTGGDTGVQSTFHASADSASRPKSTAPLLRRGRDDAGRDPKHAGKAGDSPNPTRRAGFLIHDISRAQKRRRSETSDKPEGVEQICSHRALQNGGHTHPQRPAKSGRLDGESGSERRLFYDSNSRGGPSFPQILVQRAHVSVPMPPLRPGMCPVGLHQDPEASRSPTETAGGAFNRLHRRHTDLGGVQGGGSGPCNRSGIFTGKPRLRSKQSQVSIGTNTDNRVSGFPGQLTQTRAEPPSREDKKDQSRNTSTARGQASGNQKTVPTIGKASGGYQGSAPGAPIFPQTSACSEAGPGTIRPGLFQAVNPLHRGVRRTAVVARPSDRLERQVLLDRKTINGDRIRCLHSRVGSDMRGSPHRRPLVSRGETVAYQLPRGTSSLSCTEVLCQRQERRYSAAEIGQHICRLIREQVGRDSVPQVEQHCKGPVAVVHEQRCILDSGAPPGHPEHDSRRRVSSDEGSVRLDVGPTDIPTDTEEMGSTRSGHVCLETNCPAGQILQLETRPRGRSHGCVQPRLDQHPGEGLCQPPMESLGQSPEQNTTAESHTGSDSTSLEEPALVPNPARVAGGFSTAPSTEEGSDHPNTCRVHARDGTSTSRLAYLRRRYQDKEVSEEGTELLLASWRQKSSRSYDSLFRKWVDWCDERNSDPVSGSISHVVNFLAHLFKEGYQYRSLNSYRSAISSVHERVDGYEVGQHPLVSRVMKGAFNLRPPQPRYETTWDVTKVLNYIESLGSSESLSLRDLSWKLAMLLALTRPSRSADLVKLDLRFRRYSPEGVTFQEAGLAKQSRAGKPRAEFFFPAFESRELCPKATLQVYEQRTESFRAQEDTERTRLFLAVVKPHKPISSSTLARWLKSLINNAGIDTAIFKAHSVRGAAASAAANAGVTTSDILKAADWSSESVFTKFYYKPVQSGAFGAAVLSNGGSVTLQTTTVDMETEPSEI